MSTHHNNDECKALVFDYIRTQPEYKSFEEYVLLEHVTKETEDRMYFYFEEIKPFVKLTNTEDLKKRF